MITIITLILTYIDSIYSIQQRRFIEKRIYKFPHHYVGYSVALLIRFSHHVSLSMVIGQLFLSILTEQSYFVLTPYVVFCRKVSGCKAQQRWEWVVCRGLLHSSGPQLCSSHTHELQRWFTGHTLAEPNSHWEQGGKKWTKICLRSN